MANIYIVRTNERNWVKSVLINGLISYFNDYQILQYLYRLKEGLHSSNNMIFPFKESKLFWEKIGSAKEQYHD